jgi:putative ABC transport system permease protein
MVISPLQRKMLRDLRRMGPQAITIALVIASAVAGFIACLSAVDALERSRERFYREARFGDVFVSLVRAPRSLLPRILELDGIAQAEAGIERVVRIDLSGRVDPLSGRLIGLSPAARAGQSLNQVLLRQGHWPASQTAVADQLEALVSEGFAQAHGLRPGDRVQALIQGRRRHLLITGIALSPDTIFAGMGGAPDPRGFGVFWIDEAALASACDLTGAFNHLVVRLAPGSGPDALASQEARVIDELQRLLRPWGARLAHGREHQSSHAMLDNEIREQQVIGTILPAIFAAVAAFLVHGVMSRQIATQREQIAALKALGLSNRSIASHHLQGVMLIAGAGGILGVAVGYLLGAGLASLYAEFFRFPALEHRLPPQLALTSVVMACTVAAGGALQAVRAATRVPPALAMQPAAPRRYRHLWIERLTGSLMQPGLGMVVRNIARRPWRTGLSVLGVACAFALVVLGNFVRDAIETIEIMGFEQSLRADLMVWLIEPRQAVAGRELLRLPGVRLTEPWREVQVQLRHGAATQRVRLQGGPAEPELRRVIDIDGRAHRLPAGGLLLSDRLALRLQARVGDTVTIEVLEGRMPVVSAPIAALVRDTMGLNAWMQRDALNRLLGEDDLASTQALWLEPGSRTPVLSALRSLPVAAGVFSKATLQANMKEVSARNVRIMSTVMTAFAIVIAVGVVYNQARVLLAERSHELASLRVLGLTRAEVSALLLGEVLIGLVLALPLGAAAGLALVHAVAGLLATDQFLFPVTIQARTHLLAGATVVLTTLVTGALVRRRIDRLDLVGVLKTRE